jgi:hypothetical protein
MSCTTSSGAVFEAQITYHDDGIYIDGNVANDATFYAPNSNDGDLWQDDNLEFAFDVALDRSDRMGAGDFKLFITRSGALRFDENFATHLPSRVATISRSVSRAGMLWSFAAKLPWSMFQTSMSGKNERKRQLRLFVHQLTCVFRSEIANWKTFGWNQNVSILYVRVLFVVVSS